jgi:hypothetical protein
MKCRPTPERWRVYVELYARAAAPDERRRRRSSLRDSVAPQTALTRDRHLLVVDSELQLLLSCKVGAGQHAEAKGFKGGLSEFLIATTADRDAPVS